MAFRLTIERRVSEESGTRCFFARYNNKTYFCTAHRHRFSAATRTLFFRDTPLIQGSSLPLTCPATWLHSRPRFGLSRMSTSRSLTSTTRCLWFLKIAGGTFLNNPEKTMPLTLLCPKINTPPSFLARSHAKVFTNLHYFFTSVRHVRSLSFWAESSVRCFSIFANAAFVAQLAAVKAFTFRFYSSFILKKVVLPTFSWRDANDSAGGKLAALMRLQPILPRPHFHQNRHFQVRNCRLHFFLDNRFQAFEFVLAGIEHEFVMYL